MTDNLNVTPGSGVVVAADDVGGTLYQRIKMVLGSDGINDGDISEINPIPSRTSGRFVNITLSLDTNVYSDGDVLAETQIVEGACIGNDKVGKLKSVVIIDKDDQGHPFALLFFSANVSLGTENSTPNISDADAVNYLGKIEIGTLDFDDLGGVRVACIPADLPILPVSGSDDIYVAALSRGTGTYSASGIVVGLYFE